MRFSLAQAIQTNLTKAEETLALPEVQADNDLAKEARRCLIRQLHHGGRVLALLRDGKDADAELSLLGKRADEANEAIDKLRRKTT